MPAVEIRLDGTPIEDDVLEGATITYGRQRTTDLVEPSTATITVLTPAAPWPWTIGSTVEIDATVNSVDYRRFTGRVTQIDASRYTTTLTAISSGLGAVAIAANPELTITSWAGGLAGALDTIITTSVTGVATAFDIGTTDPINPYTIDAASVLEQLRQVAALDLQGVIWEQTDGTVCFSDAEARSSITPVATIDAGTVADNWVASATVSSVINRVTITYNAGAAVLTADDAPSITAHGLRSYEQQYDVDNASDASTRASKILVGYSDPSWITNPISIELTTVATVAEVEDLLQLEVGTPIDLAAVNAVIDVVPEDAFVEGWTDTISQNRYRLDLWTSDVRVTRTPQKWQDVTPTLAWSSVSGTLTWTDAIGTTL